MKKTTKSISDWYNNKLYEERLLQLLTNNSGFSVNETSIEEALEEFEYCKQIITSLIENQTFDNITFTTRNKILEHLINISNTFRNLKGFNFLMGDPRANALGTSVILTILKLRDFVDSSLLAQKLKGYYKYSEQTKELNKIKRRYNNLIKYIEKAEFESRKVIGTSSLVEKQSNELLEKINSTTLKSEDVVKVEKQLKYQFDKFNSIVKDSENKLILINSIFKNSEEIEKTFNKSKTSLDSKIKILDEQAKKFIDETKEKYELNAKDLNDNSERIDKENLNLQKRIKVLLEGANAGKLNQSFSIAKKVIEDKLSKWIAGIFITTLLLVLLPLLIIYGNERLGIPELSGSGFDGAFYIKLLISIPLIFLDYFFISRYNSEKNLAEKYNFKSVLSLSILAYNDMLTKNDNNISQKFILNTVEKIYESPFEQQKLTKKELEILNSLAQKGLDNLDSLSKVIADT
jgi:hypothetical protein